MFKITPLLEVASRPYPSPSLMFHHHKTSSDEWYEFECPHCHFDMDVMPAHIPPMGVVFECPQCCVRLTAGDHHHIHNYNPNAAISTAR